MEVLTIMNQDVKTISINDTVSKALGLMEQEHVKELPVISEGRLKGLVTLHLIVTNTNYSPNTKVSKLMFKPPVLTPETSVIDAVSVMAKSGLEGLPVVNNNELIGFISDYDLIKALKELFNNLTVNDLMNELPSTLKDNDELSKARRLFYYTKTSALPVINNEGRVTGVVTEEELIRFCKPHESMSKGMAEGESIKQLKAKIKSLNKTNQVILVGSSMTQAINKMLGNHWKALIVINEDEEPIGYLERFELIRHAYKMSKPKGVSVNINGYELDYLTSSLMNNIIINYLNKLSYIKRLTSVNVHLKPIHTGSGAKKFEVSVKLRVNNKDYRSKSDGYSLPETLNKILRDLEKVIKKDYKKK